MSSRNCCDGQKRAKARQSAISSSDSTRKFERWSVRGFRGSSEPNSIRPTSFSRCGRAFSSTPDSRDFDNVEHLRRFLFGMVRNKVREQHRRLTRTEKYDLAREERLYVRRGDREVPREVVSPDPSPSSAVQAADRMAQLTAGRSPLEIEVITLRRQGLTFVEIAERTGINERTVRRVIESVRSMVESHRWQ